LYKQKYINLSNLIGGKINIESVDEVMNSIYDFFKLDINVDKDKEYIYNYLDLYFKDYKLTKTTYMI